MRLRDANRTFEVQLYAQIPAACNVALLGATGEASGEVRQVCGCTGYNAKRGRHFRLPGCRIPSAALRAGAPFRPVGCSPITTKCCLRPPDPLFFNGIEDMMAAPILPTALSC